MSDAISSPSASAIDPAAHVPLVVKISRAYERQRRLAPGEAMGDAWLGLLNAVRLFRPEGGASFATFAARKIRWAIIDAHRAREHCKAGNVDGGTIRRGARRLATHRLTEHADRTLADRRSGPDQLALVREHARTTAQRLDRAARRTAQRRTVARRTDIAALLTRGMTFRQIQAATGLSDSALAFDLRALRQSVASSMTA